MKTGYGGYVSIVITKSPHCSGRDFLSLRGCMLRFSFNPRHFLVDQRHTVSCFTHPSRFQAAACGVGVACNSPLPSRSGRRPPCAFPRFAYNRHLTVGGAAHIAVWRLWVSLSRTRPTQQSIPVTPAARCSISTGMLLASTRRSLARAGLQRASALRCRWIPYGVLSWN